MFDRSQATVTKVDRGKIVVSTCSTLDMNALVAIRPAVPSRCILLVAVLAAS